MTTTRDDGAVVVLKLLGEGGGYTILGRETRDGAWQFKVDGHDATPAIIDEEPIVRRGDWVPTLQDVLGQINRGWYRLHAREVHPRFKTALLTEVTRCMLTHTGADGNLARNLETTYQRWQEICGVPASKNPSPLSNIRNPLGDALRRAERVVILTGAGVSAESGIPTFRDEQTGFWERFEALDLATPQAFERDPALVWGWYEWRRALVRRAQPNPAHRAIAELEKHVPRLTLITQNVDDLHERAGSRRAIHLHGSLEQPRCSQCRTPYAHPDGIPELPEGGARLEPPQCSACGGQVRPGVVWFGESLPELEWLAAVEAVKACEVFLAVGTSAVVQPAASLLDLANRAGAPTVIVNPNPTEADEAATFAMRGRAGELLPQLVREVWCSRA